MSKYDNFRIWSTKDENIYWSINELDNACKHTLAKKALLITK